MDLHEVPLDELSRELQRRRDLADYETGKPVRCRLLIGEPNEDGHRNVVLRLASDDSPLKSWLVRDGETLTISGIFTGMTAS
jgi:hypothetical protein